MKLLSKLKSRNAMIAIAIIVGITGAVIIAFVGVNISIARGIASGDGQDPHWNAWNFETDSLDEIESICGTEWLLDRMTLSEECHVKYSLSVSEDYAFNDLEKWMAIEVMVNYGEDEFDTGATSLECLISFDDKMHGWTTKTILEELNASTEELYGVPVTYIEITNEDAAKYGFECGGDASRKYHGRASFCYKGVNYYINTDSEDVKFFSDTLKRMLS